MTGDKRHHGSMARLREKVSSDDELPSLSEVLARSQDGVEGRTRTERSPPHRVGKEQGARKLFEDGKENHIQELKVTERGIWRAQPPIKAIISGGTPNRKQKPLQKARVNSLLLPISCQSSKAERLGKAMGDSKGESAVRSSPRKTTQRVDYKGFVADLGNALNSEDEDSIRSPRRCITRKDNSAARVVARSSPKSAAKSLDYKKFISGLGDALESDEGPSFDDLSDFIVNDSTSEAEAVPSLLLRKNLRSPSKASTLSEGKPRNSNSDILCLEEVFQPEVVDLISPVKDDTTSINIPRNESTARTYIGNPFSTLNM